MLLLVVGLIRFVKHFVVKVDLAIASFLEIIVNANGRFVSKAYLIFHTGDALIDYVAFVNLVCFRFHNVRFVVGWCWFCCWIRSVH